MTVESICPQIQTDIVEILPDNGHTALKVISQLSANMLVSIDGADIELFIKDVRDYFSAYKAQQ